MPTILVIDDDRAIRMLTERALSGIARVVTAADAAEGMRMLSEVDPDAVLLDIFLPDTNGMAVFCQIREIDRKLPVIFMTVEAGSDTTIEAMRLGAFDYLAKPINVSQLTLLANRALEARRLNGTPVSIAADADEAKPGESFIGRSPEMLEVFKAIGRVAAQEVTVLIRGESGTGKELVARALCQHSDRVEEPFLAVNCAALPDNLLESELFGHEKGAFTGADSRRIGKFEQCHGGTLFLDEVGDMSPSVQAKVLRVLQDQHFERVGGTKTLRTDVRVIAATNRNLETMVEAGEFREDLLYRLNGVTIHLPPLRQRRADLPLLIAYFLREAKVELNKPDLDGISPEAVEVLCAYDWPGNVRQLRAVLRSAVLTTPTSVIGPAWLPREVTSVRPAAAENHPAAVAIPAAGGSPVNSAAAALAGHAAEETAARLHEAGSGSAPAAPVAGENADLAALVEAGLNSGSTNLYAEALELMERFVLARVLRETDGNQSRAADILGITRGKVRDWIATYGIELRREMASSTDS